MIRSMSDLSLDDLSPATLWPQLDRETQQLAAEALYLDTVARREADQAIAAAIRFRDAAVRRLPAAERVRYLLKAVRPDDSLASALLLAMHLEHRRPLLSAFLDKLGIPQDDGVIDADFDLEPPAVEQLSSATRELRENFPHDDVQLYMASLIALDPDAWGGLTELL